VLRSTLPLAQHSSKQVQSSRTRISGPFLVRFLPCRNCFFFFFVSCSPFTIPRRLGTPHLTEGVNFRPPLFGKIRGCVLEQQSLVECCFDSRQRFFFLHFAQEPKLSVRSPGKTACWSPGQRPSLYFLLRRDYYSIQLVDGIGSSSPHPSVLLLFYVTIRQPFLPLPRPHPA